MRERALELSGKNDESAVLAKIGEMVEPDKTFARKIHALVLETAPQLHAKTWYGMPAYANQDGKVICFFQSGHKYKSRYCTLGFSDSANLDDGAMYPTGYAIKDLTPTEEARIKELVKKAIR